MPYKTYEQRMEYVRRWVESGLTQVDFCLQEGINRKTFGDWIKLAKKGGLLPATRLESPYIVRSDAFSRSNQPADIITAEKVPTSMVKVTRSRTKSIVHPLNGKAPITIEYMGAKISIDEGSIESVFRALKAVSGCNL